MNRTLLPVSVLKRWLLFDAALVREILGAQAWLPIPHARAELPGVLAWRGRAIPLVDIAPVFALRGLGAREVRGRTLIVEYEQALAAVPVDEAREVRGLPARDLLPVHAAPLPYATAEIDAGGVVMPVIDLAALLQDLAARIGGNDGAHD